MENVKTTSMEKESTLVRKNNQYLRHKNNAKTKQGMITLWNVQVTAPWLM